MKKRTLHKPAKPRGKPDKWYNDRSWHRLRDVERNRHPLCCYCLPDIKPTKDIDHVRPKALYPELSKDPKNLVGVCGKCHAKKTRLEQECHSKEDAEMKLKWYITKSDMEHGA